MDTLGGVEPDIPEARMAAAAAEAEAEAAKPPKAGTSGVRKTPGKISNCH